MIVSSLQTMLNNPYAFISGRRTHLIQLFYKKNPLAGFRRPCTLLFLVFALLLSTACDDPEAKFSKLMSDAQTSMDAGEFDAARINLQSAIDIKPKNAEAYYQLAESLVRLGKIRAAVENYNTAINYDPTHRDALLHLSSILLAGRQFEMAESNVQKVLDRSPEDTEALVLKANIEAAGPRKDRDAAREILSGVLEKETDNIVALASLANIELADGNHQKAEELYQKALKVTPENGPVQMALADLYARQGRLTEAQDVLSTLVTQNPEQSSLRYVYGEFLLRRGLGDEAIEQYKETLLAEPTRHDARDRLYDMYLTREKVEEAKALTDELIAAAPDNSGVNYFKGRNAQLENKQEEALKFFLESIKLMNNFGPAFRRAGLIELSLGQTREAVEHLNQAVAIESGDVSARLALAKVLFRKQDFAQAKQHLEQVLRRYPRQLAANVQFADIAVVEGELSKARKVYEYLVESAPNNPAGYYKLGILEEKAENADRAIELYRKALSFDKEVLGPARRLVAVRSRKGDDLGIIIDEVKALQEKSEDSKPEYDLLLGTLLLANDVDADRFEKARRLFLRALDDRPNLVGAYFALGAIDSVSGKLDSAAENYNKLLEQNPNHIPTHMMLALTYERMGAMDKSAEVYRDILKIRPRFGPASNNLAWLLAAELDGNLDEALRLAETAKEELPSEPSVADTLGWIHYKRGSARAALPFIEEAVQLHKEQNFSRPPNPEILLHLATVQAELDEKAKAKKNLALAMKYTKEDHPKYAEMKKLFEELP